MPHTKAAEIVLRPGKAELKVAAAAAQRTFTHPMPPLPAFLLFLS